MNKKTILVIEDSPELSESIADILSIKDYDSILTHSGVEGVKLALEKRPDLILLDVRLPDIDGYEVFKRIREDSWGKTAKVSILTASESIENISKNVNLPIEYVLFKPDLSVQDLLDKVESRLKD